MSRGPRTFRQNDVVRAIRATEAAGKEVERVEIGRDGRIVVVLGSAASAPRATVDAELESWLDED